MTSRRISCPVCGTTRLKPSPHVPTTPWSSDCACCDAGRCVAHRYNPDDMPKRPDDLKMEQLAHMRAQNKIASYERDAEIFASISNVKSKHEELMRKSEEIRLDLLRIREEAKDTYLKSALSSILKKFDDF